VLSGQGAGQTVLKRGKIDKDLYVAGGHVDVIAEVNGDVVAAGGRVTINSQVTGDVLAAGGNVTVQGRVSDDIRLAGGDVIINASAGDGVVVAGGNVLFAPDASAGGDVMIGGGHVELAGKVRGNVAISAGEVVISGQVDGNVELTSGSIKIKPGAVIRGSLTYRSPVAAEIDSQARIVGKVSHIKMPRPGPAEIAAVATKVGLFVWLGIALTGIVLYLLFPSTAMTAARTAGAKPWKSLGLGLALLAAIPVLGIVLMITGIGWLLALLLLLAYVLLLWFGFLAGVLFVSDALLRRMRKGEESSKLVNSLVFALALLVIMILGLVPLLGGLLLFILLLLGIGCLGLKFHGARREAAP
jgi:hypothetical protein